MLGAGGEFWRYGAGVTPGAAQRGQLISAQGDPAAFARLDLAGVPKAAINFTLRPAAFGCQALMTETRIHTAGEEMQRKFAAYWRAILPGSALIRPSWLDAIRRRAEMPVK